jgi:enoyl-CoA hydratase/carnithine racemase
MADGPTTGKLIARREGALGWIILNNPARHNALSLGMYEALGRRVAEFAADPAIRTIILAGEGGRAFAAGADISEFEAKRATAAAIARYDEVSDSACLTLETCDKPTIAMIQGYCIGGGMDLALRCDFRIAAPDASFGVPAARLGLGYGFADVKRLVDTIGPAAAKEVLYTGRRFSAEEALRMGFLHRIVPPAELAAAVRALAETLAANAPMTIRAMKRCIAEAAQDPALRDLEACRRLVDACFASADYAEGRRAFMEKRKPAFKGR